jgi:hypothetical protein
MVFTQFVQAVKDQFAKMQSKNGNLFVSKLNGRDLTDLYLSSLEGHDPVFRDPNSTTHTCNHCKNFLRRYGNTVSINAAGEIETMFDNTTVEGNEYHFAAVNIGNALRAAGIESEFIETFDELQVLPYEKGVKKSQSHFKIGVASNVKCYTKAEAEMYGVVTEGETLTFNHFHAVLENKFVNSTGKSVAQLVGESKTQFQLLEKAMKISPSTYEETLDFVNRKVLLNAEDAAINNIKKTMELQKAIVGKTNYTNLLWLKSKEAGSFCRFINNLLGETIQKINAGEDLVAVCNFYNKAADSANWMKATAPVTLRQRQETEKFFEDNGYIPSIPRRHATMDDINISEIRHVNRDVKTSTKPMSIFDNIKVVGVVGTTGTRKQFDKCETVTMSKFMEEILPNAERVEVLFEGSQKDNLAVITTTVNPDAKPMFSWENNFSWTTKQNLAGKSFIKEAVKAQGGKVDGVFRASLSWAEDEPNNNTDLDLHCIEPNGSHIYYGKKVGHSSGGNLDVDIIQPYGQYRNKNIVENIIYTMLSHMSDGIYKVFVNVYNNRGGSDFTVEIEFNGQITTFKYSGSYSGKDNIHVCDVELQKGVFTIVKTYLPFSENNSKTQKVWNIDTNTFHPVSLVSLSPNYWGDANVGNRHYFFAIQNCKADEELRSFHNENLKPEFRAYRGTTELLGAHATVKPSPDQLAGLMFNATVQESVVVKATHNGVAKVYNVSTI